MNPWADGGDRVRQLTEERDAALARAAVDAQRFESLQAMVLAVAEARSTGTMLEVVLGRGLAVTGADAGLVAIADRGAGVARVIGAVGTVAPQPEFPLERTNVVGRCVIDARAEFAHGPPPFHDPGPAGGIGGEGSTAVLPLPAGDGVLGAVVLSYRDRQPFDERQVLGLTTVANVAAAALVRVRLLEEEHAARDELNRLAERNAFLAEATAVVATPLDERTVLERLARLCVPRLGDWCSITRPRGDELERIIVHHGDPELAGLARSLQGRTLPVSSETPVATTFRTGTPRVLPDLGRAMALDPDFTPAQVELFRRLGDAAGIVVPIGHASRPVGVLAFAVGEGRALTEDDLALAGEIALRAGIAVGHAADFARERDAAAVLQRALLPIALPSGPRFEVAAAYRPADLARTIGGDWFDVCPLDQRRLAVVVGDVAGHGVAAAAGMSLLRNALRAYLFEGHPPGEALRRLNRLVLAERPERHATVVAAVFDVEAGQLVSANAGHLSPLRWDGSGRVEPVEGPRGPMLGVFADPDYPEHRITLEQEDTLLLFTDGLVERRRLSLDDALSALCRKVEGSVTDGDLQGWCEALVRSQGSASDHDDDSCVLALRAGPPPAGPVDEAVLPPADVQRAAVGGEAGVPLLRLDLDPRPGAARTVRGWLGTILDGHPRLAELQLCATEVVTNAVLHAATPFTVTVSEADGCIRVAVRDASPVMPRPRSNQLTGPSGRGLLLIEALSVAWGAQSDGGGKVVWFDFAG